MHIWQSLGAAIMLVTASMGAQAAEKSWTVEGGSLRIAKSCARTIDIQPNGAVHQVSIAARADKDGEISQLTVAGGEVATLDINASRCYTSGFFSTAPTLALTIKVPDGAAIEVHDGGLAHYTIGAVNGTLDISLAGAGALKAAGGKTLSLDLSGVGSADIGEAGDSKIRTGGTGDVTIHGLKGTLDARLSGAGSLTVDRIEAASANVTAAGRSDIKFGAGDIGSFTLDSAGASDVAVEAVVRDAKVSVAGAGGVKFAKVTGHLDQSVSGVGTVKVLDH